MTFRLLVASLFAVASCNAMGLDPNGDCPIVTLLPFSNQSPLGDRQESNMGEAAEAQRAQGEPMARWSHDLLHHFSYTYMAAAQMAMDHFNDRDPIVVPELEELGDCTVQFPYQVVADSGLTETNSIMGVLTAHHERLAEQFMKPAQRRRQRQLLPDGLPDPVMCPDLAEFSFSNLLPPWCAVLGPKNDKAIAQVSALTGSLDIPQMIYGPVTHIAYESPAVVGVSLPDLGRAKAIISYLQRPGLERNYLAVLHAKKPIIDDVAQSIKSMVAREFGLKVVTRETQRPKPGENPQKLYQKAVEWLKGTGMKTILVAFDDPNDIQGIAKALDQESMLGTDYVYLLLEEGVPLDRINDVYGGVEEGSPLDKLLSGAAVISQTDNFSIENEDPFEKAWKMQNASFVGYLNEITPKDQETGEPLFQAEPTFFQDERPAAMAGYMYDSVIAVGLGACRHEKLQPQLPKPPLGGPLLEFGVKYP